jgi:hypothetical protein
MFLNLIWAEAESPIRKKNGKIQKKSEVCIKPDSQVNVNHLYWSGIKRYPEGQRLYL